MRFKIHAGAAEAAETAKILNAALQAEGKKGGLSPHYVEIPPLPEGFKGWLCASNYNHSAYIAITAVGGSCSTAGRSNGPSKEQVVASLSLEELRAELEKRGEVAQPAKPA